MLLNSKIIGLLLVLSAGVQAHLNVYLNLVEVLRLIGVSAELYYVREGQVNDYALQINVPVPAHINEVSFTWQSLAQHPLPYSINILTSDTELLPRPTLNITRIGDIPLTPQTFAIGMKCSGSAEGEVDVSIEVQIILDQRTNNVTDLVFKRKKFCLKDEPHLTTHQQQPAQEAVYTYAPAVEAEEQQQQREQHGQHVAQQHPPQLDQESAHTFNAHDLNKHEINLGRPTGVLNEFDPLLRETVVVPPSPAMITLIVGSVLALLLVVVVLVIAYCAKGPTKRPSHGMHLTKTSSFQRLPTISSTAHNTLYVCPNTVTPTYATLTRPFREYEQQPDEFNRRIAELTVQKCRVRLSSLMQDGVFARVYRGTYDDTQDVIVKSVAPNSGQIQVTLLLQEAMMLHEIAHPNVLSVLGISIEDCASPFVLYPASGSLRNLKGFLQDPSCVRTMTSIQTVLMASQMATALDFLHQNGVVHKDVAARNCFIDDQLRVKISDSALSRDLFASDYYCLNDGECRPIKWLALEAIQKNHYSEASDVWAFGVLIWEICTLGKSPYAEIDPYEMEHYLKDGYRLAQPYNCPDELFTIMAYCWASLPMERPTFTQLQACLSEFHTQLTRYV